MLNLPQPDAAAMAVSNTLVAQIRGEIAQAGGVMDFSRYMELALYAPGLGYYSAGAQKLGGAGDFVTAPEISPLFGEVLAGQIAQVLAQCGGNIYEAGAGSGVLAATVLSVLARKGMLPEQYCILEPSPDLRERQASRLAQQVPEWFDRVVWLDSWPDSLRGCVIANEVLDAMPVHVVHWQKNKLVQRGVTIEDGGLAWGELPLPDGALREAAQAIDVPADYVNEIGLIGQAWVADLARRLTAGALLLIDYGFGEREYYHPQRRQGTLMCHYRHHAHDNPFFLPGLQDITAHVDFTAVAVAGIREGLELAGYTSQAYFLINGGITDLLAQVPLEPALQHARVTAAAQRLLSPSEMGELFKVLALTRNISQPLLGFVQGDMRRRL